MLPTFVIGLREGVEAALIVGIVAAFLSRHGRREALRWVWTGVGLAALLCLGVGVGLHLLEASLPHKQQEGLETVIALVAVAAITYMVVWMKRNSRGLRQSLEADASAALAQNSVKALVLMAFLAVLREGFETAVFVVAVLNSSSDRGAASIGVALGLLVATVLGYALYRGGVRVNLSRFFRVTGVVLVFVAAGLVASALHTAHEAGWFNALQSQALDLSAIVAPGTVRAALLTGMLGLQPKPTLGETLGWLIYVIPFAIFVAWPAGSVARGPRLRWRAARRTNGVAGMTLCVVALTLPLLLAACGGDDDKATAASGKATTVEVKITKAGCDPATLNLASGPTTFKVKNDGANAVTEFEVLDGDRILGEVENLTPGLSGSFTLNLQPGTFKLLCPGGETAETGTLTVTGAAGTPAAADLSDAVTAYRTYLEQQTQLLVERTTSFVAAVTQGDVERAKREYAPARVPYESIEPVAESFGDLDPAIDAREGDVPADEWGGFHRIEQALWVTGSLDGMQPVADTLLADVRTLQTNVQRVELDAAQIANGAVELLNEVSQSKVTGEEERYSRTDLYDFDANVAGAKAAFDALAPALRARNAALADQIETRFSEMATALQPYRQGDGWMAYTQLTDENTKALSQAVDALAEPLSQVAETVLGQPSA
jgi:FTR1 family protein